MTKKKIKKQYGKHSEAVKWHMYYRKKRKRPGLMQRKPGGKWTFFIRE